MELKLRLQRMLQILEDVERAGVMSDLEKDMILADLREAYSEVKFGVVLSENNAPAQTEPEAEEIGEPEMEVEILFAEEDDADAQEDPTTEAGAEPIAEVEAIAVAETAPEVAPEVTPEPETEGEVEADTETETEESAEEESSVAPMAVPLAAVAATATVAEAAAETAVGAATSVVEPAAESIAEAVVEPIAESAAEPIAEAVVEAPVVEAAAPILEPVVEQVVEAPAVEPVAEPIVEKPIEAETPAMDDELSIVNSQLSANKPHRNAILSLYEEAPTVVGEQFRDNSTSVADMIASTTMGVASVAPIASLRGAIGVADKFMLVQDLFGGDDAAYDLAINTLDSLPSFDDCVIFISENYAWSPNSDGAKFMMELLQRKYNA